MLLKKIYDTHKGVSDTFDAVIWVTVAWFPILKLQGAIACEINLDLAETYVEKMMMKLTAYLRDKNIFLVLDDMWTSFDLFLVWSKCSQIVKKITTIISLLLGFELSLDYTP